MKEGPSEPFFGERFQTACVTNAEGSSGRESLAMRCCARDEGLWPFGAVLRGMVPNRHMLRWLTTVVVSDVEKAAVEPSGGDQEDERK
jgi:hypothetical protein